MTELSHLTREARWGWLRHAAFYSVVILAGPLLWLIVWSEHLQTIPVDASEDTIGLTGVLMVSDLVLGIAVVACLPLRYRFPRSVALLAALSLLISATAAGAAAVAIVRFAVVGSRKEIALTGAVWTAALIGNWLLLVPTLGMRGGTAETLTAVLVGILVYVALVAVGRYRRARSETLALLRERAERAEREGRRAVQAARESERLRIAREMHDVLAHRISLVVMHAGALVYREDMPRASATDAAQTIRDSAALALTELRSVLGVLRGGEGLDERGPQPLIEHVPVLLAEARAAGASITFDSRGFDDPSGIPTAFGLRETTSRAGYRIVQEALTNARKHAPGETVYLRLARTEGHLVISCRNRLVREAVTGSAPSGMGLIGLAERAQLAGGTLDTRATSDDFILEGKLPWDTLPG